MAPGDMYSGLYDKAEAQTNTSAGDDLDLVTLMTGSVLGAMMAVLVLLMCVRCLKFEKAQGLSYAVSDNSGSHVNIVGFHGFSSDPSPRPTSSAVDNFSRNAIHQQQIHTPDLPYHQQSPSNANATRSNNNNTNSSTYNNSETVRRIDQHINSIIQDSKDSSNDYNRSNENSSIAQGTTNKANSGRSGNVLKTSSKSLVEKRPSILRHLSFSKRSTPSTYGRLEEDRYSIAESQTSQGSEGIDNPIFMRGVPARGSMMSEDALSVMSTDTLKRRNKMRSESAVAIAVLRNSQTTLNFDTDFIVDNNDVTSEVVFNERTEL